MPGFSPRLPLSLHPVDGAYGLNKTIVQTIRQNLENLIRTSPGERIMIPAFGVGLRRFLFEAYRSRTFDEIKARITNQAAQYMPAIVIKDVVIRTSDGEADIGSNSIAILVAYNIPALNVNDSITIMDSLPT